MIEARNTTSRRTLLFLILGSLGVVFGDIGTSPLYAVNQIFFGKSHVTLTYQNILGSISLIIWALTIVITLKYIVFVLLANHEGQGGVFALLSLLRNTENKKGIIFLVGSLILAAGLLFGEGLVTAAISVLSAVEGLSISTNVFEPYIVPITLLILLTLFAFQYKGTKIVGTIFGPIMALWFIVIGFFGLLQIIAHPEILNAFNPVLGFVFLSGLNIKQFLLFFGALVLVVAGVESLYADMGHFGARPIRIGWIFLVYPMLLLNYIGQGAFLLRGAPVINGNIFYSLIPYEFIIPMVILATIATANATQALISGAYSLVAQAVALNYLPRVRIIHTNRDLEGQIYVPAVNWLLFIGSAALVLSFKTSTALANVYGFASAGLMLSTSLAMLTIASLYWHWPWWKSIAIFGCFALIDILFFVSKGVLFFEGAYVPTAIGVVLFIIMNTWYWGRKLIHDAYAEYEGERAMTQLVDLKRRLQEGQGVINDKRGQFVEAARTLIFLVHRPVLKITDAIPIIIRSHMKHSGSIPKYAILLHVSREPKPYVRANRYEITDFGFGLHGVEVRFGFMEGINLETVIEYLNKKAELPGLESDKYMIEVGKEELRTHSSKTPLFSYCRVQLYRFLQRLAAPSYRYFGLAMHSGLSTISIPVIVGEKTGVIEIPELDLSE
jgi:KUP system potassium uptake protein